MKIEIRLADWATDQAALRQIREQVFILEQAVPVELEWDEQDASAWHFLVLADQQPIGTARLLADGHIGRVAILPAWRGQQIGSALMQAVIAEAEQRALIPQQLAAQTHALSFYQRLGFRVIGEVFMDAGIPHQAMIRP